MVKWTCISDRTLAIDAVGAINHYTKELGLAYHNYDHVVAMYDYLERTREPYDEALDWAVLFHDIVYDKDPQKEVRSAEMFEFNATIPKYGVNPDIIPRTKAMILATSDHVAIPEVSAIVRADLHELTNKISVVQNFGKIMEESMSLYGIDEDTFARNSEKTMTALLHRVSHNTVTDPTHQDFYLDACEGILLAIKLAQSIQTVRY